VPEDGLGSLGGCFVEGDAQSEKHARLVKRRALAVSIVLQTVALAALVLFPLLSKGERISLKDMTPIPPYTPIGNTHHSATPRQTMHSPAVCRICASPYVPGHIVMHDPTPPPEREGQEGEIIPGLLPAPGVHGGYTPMASRPEAPQEDATRIRAERRFVSEGVQMAQLITRVEPIYPILAIQTHKEGRVELRAFISPEGKIESLEVISGDPFFIQSALSAVRQWRYRPTILNGRTVEVDTHITVIYTLSH
jgi:protein TonB